MKYIPHERLIVTVDPEPAKTAGGIHLPEGYQPLKNQIKGRVEAYPPKWEGVRGSHVIFSAGSPREGQTYFVSSDAIYAFIDE